ncbi:MAG: mannonate oxidoreductase [Intestinibacter bartlettii]|uniref:MutS-related protein n=1 Tax=Intestinibacter bartlettii TaxID=261299 RepID=UPI0026F18174|nr:mannonate oxidoreductase [Intestinibacter bartlettii]MDO5010367.1 mannonate oxidoreductase [Intestinibacter bartlettii]
MKIENYKNDKIKVEKDLKEMTKKSDLISWIRVALFILVIAFLAYGYFKKNNLFYVLSVVLTVGFLAIVKYHSNIEAKVKYKESKVQVYKRYIKRLNSTWYDFKDKGTEYLDENMPYLKDLDIFGEGSLYQYICSANTIYGKISLVKHLKQQDHNLEDIIKYQEAVKELSSMQDFADEIQTLSYLIKENKKKNINKEIKKFIEVCENKVSNQSKINKILMIILPAAFIALVVLSLIGINPMYFNVLKLVLIINLLIAFANMQKSTAILAPVGDFYKNLKVYENIFKEIENTDFKSPYLKELKNTLNKDGGSVNSIKELKKIGSYIELRQNFLGNVLLNGIFLWDFHCIDMFDKWKLSYGKNIRTYLEVVGEIETLISLASITYIRDDYTFPNISDLKDANPNIDFKNLKHPLIKIEDAVGNSINLNGQTCVITGSNMSGKTTFLRSIGINLVLAYAGGPVLASNFNASVMKVLTSIRVEDNVNKGISTFYAELLRIKDMTEYNKNKRPMICLIDEIFKGTNSADRIICATEAIKKLSQPWSITLVSTHDFELCNLEEDKSINAVNYHFAEYYENDKIKFDYKIRDGRCVTTNAKVLLKMAGIVDDIK